MTFFYQNTDSLWCDDQILQKVASLDQSDFPHPWKQDEWGALKESSARYFLFIDSDIAPTCFALYQIDIEDGFSHLLKIATHSQKRAEGIAKNLFSDSFCKLRSVGIDRCYLEVASTNTPAISLYKKFGFNEIRTVLRYYSNGDDATIMILTL